MRPRPPKVRSIFRDNCARCHGTYGEKWTYPNKIVPLEEIGTDPNRHRGIEMRYGLEYSNSWFGKEPNGWFVDGKMLRPTPGYQAPPLDGIWATAPYFHNGSVPTLDGVLELESQADALHSLVPHGRGGLRRGESGLARAGAGGSGLGAERHAHRPAQSLRHNPIRKEQRRPHVRGWSLASRSDPR